MKKTISKWLAAGFCALLASCAIITVNVYFPDKDVKQAYKSLDDMLLKKDGDKAPAEQKAPEGKPQSRLLPGGFDFSLIPSAHAADSQADELAIELSSMPEVLKAYDEMKTRLPMLDALRDSGAVGETNQGLVAVRDKSKITPQDEALVKAEVENRKTVITGMARAILKISKQSESKAALNQLLGKAAATYAETRREAAKPGWWVQTAAPGGRWVQK